MPVEITSEQEGATKRVWIAGRLDAQSAAPVRDALKGLAESGSDPQVWLDLSKVPFIDSTGLAALISGLKAIRARNGKLALVGVSQEVMRIFQVTLLDRVFTFVDAA